MQITEILGGVTAASGFSAGAAHAGIRRSRRDDLCLVAADKTCPAAGVFTRNRFAAAPVVVSREHLACGKLRAVILNAGCANACTGEGGLADARRTVGLVGDLLGCATEEVAVCSTGLIGSRLPMGRLERALPKVVADLDCEGGGRAAAAIMTTDTVPKEAAAEVSGPWGSFRIGGMVKGVGMLAPEMATLLCVVTTDAAVGSTALSSALSDATEHSFNRISIDGCMSTNDTVIIMAGGASGVAVEGSPAILEAFKAGLARVTSSLAAQVVADGEGASKVLTVKVVGAASGEDAVKAARTIADSVLLRCAIHGADPNWGRVLSALGTCDAAYEPGVVSVRYGKHVVAEGGQGVEFGAQEARAYLSGREVELVVDLGAGDSEATVLTNDLTPAYIGINSAYST